MALRWNGVAQMYPKSCQPIIKFTLIIVVIICKIEEGRRLFIFFLKEKESATIPVSKTRMEVDDKLFLCFGQEAPLEVRSKVIGPT